MDAFFASVEQLDNPLLKGKPVIVGADPKGGTGRGVVSACSYEARKFGVHSAMPISRAWKLCPGGVFLRPRIMRYSEISRSIFSIFRRFADLVEPLSVDEAFLDLTGSERLFGPAEDLCLKIKRTVFEEVGLVASMGLAPNKFLAKMASDLDKPNGFIVVKPGEAEKFLSPLPISKLWGVGPKSAERLKKMGVKTIGDLTKIPLENLKASFNKAGEDMFRLARGIDDRPVSPDSETKSVSAETTFLEDASDAETLEGELLFLADKVARRLRKLGLAAGSVTLKHRDENFQTSTRTKHLVEPSNLGDEILDAAKQLLARSPNAGSRTRLLGISAGSLVLSGRKQLDLFNAAERNKKQKLAETVDKITCKYGSKAISRARLLRGR